MLRYFIRKRFLTEKQVSQNRTLSDSRQRTAEPLSKRGGGPMAAPSTTLCPRCRSPELDFEAALLQLLRMFRPLSVFLVNDLAVEEVH